MAKVAWPSEKIHKHYYTPNLVNGCLAKKEMKYINAYPPSGVFYSRGGMFNTVAK